MLGYPLVTEVTPKDDLILEVKFSNGVTKEYDCKQLLDDEMYEDLNNACLFRQVHVDCGGYAVSWSEDIDISECELWDNGKTKQQP